MIFIPEFLPLSMLLLVSMMLKGPKHEKFKSGFFTHIRPLWVDDLGTGEKK
jgi:hypothetical protein